MTRKSPTIFVWNFFVHCVVTTQKVVEMGKWWINKLFLLQFLYFNIFTCQTTSEVLICIICELAPPFLNHRRPSGLTHNGWGRCIPVLQLERPLQWLPKIPISECVGWELFMHSWVTQDFQESLCYLLLLIQFLQQPCYCGCSHSSDTYWACFFVLKLLLVLVAVALVLTVDHLQLSLLHWKVYSQQMLLCCNLSRRQACCFVKRPKLAFTPQFVQGRAFLVGQFVQ